ncbi:hypothetical protein G7Y89_g12271 [Cudoniella acicularis]|uniref:Amine oxidase domain-containing protein n=1 Tax=Cudoniella acicularis TaxID=354080 RepID=A0A8H4RAR9_9HELO|nr:hypothetical protein G7Y89_g12271 [Cudoniella acicularis]
MASSTRKPVLPPEIILQVVDSLITPAVTAAVALSRSHIVTRTLCSLVLTCKLIRPVAQRLLRHHCVYLKSADQLHEFYFAMTSSGFDFITTPALYLEPYPTYDITNKSIAYDISLLLEAVSQSIKRLVIDIPLRSLYPDEDVQLVRPVLRQAFGWINNLEVFCSTQDELYLDTLVSPSSPSKEPPMWNRWKDLKVLALYNVDVSEELFWPYLGKLEKLHTVVLTRADGLDEIDFEDTWRQHCVGEGRRLQLVIVDIEGGRQTSLRSDAGEHEKLVHIRRIDLSFEHLNSEDPIELCQQPRVPVKRRGQGRWAASYDQSRNERLYDQVIESCRAHLPLEIVIIPPLESLIAGQIWKEPKFCSILRFREHAFQRPERFVWLVPADAPSGGCLNAYSGLELLGVSEPLEIKARNTRRGNLRKRDRVVLANIADAEGPWLGGVEYLKEKSLMSFLLNSVGFHDWQIVEALTRVGGRVHTSYLNGTKPDQYQYQEMGPMRFPVSITYSNTNETFDISDHKMVFQLVGAINNLNGNDSALMVNSIQQFSWIQSSPNAPATTSFRLPDGTVPSTADLTADPTLANNATLTYSNATAVSEASDTYGNWLDLTPEKIKAVATNVFTAHKAAVEAGILDFSESRYLRYRLGVDANITDQVDSLGDDYDFWYYDIPYFSATY